MGRLIILFSILIGLVIVPIAYASPTPNGYTKLLEETIDDDPTEAYSEAFYVGDKRKVTFIARDAETAGSDDSTVTVTILIDVPEANLTRANLDAVDVLMASGGTDAPVSSIAFTASGSNVFYLPQDVTIPYIVAKVTGTTTDASDYHDIAVWVAWQQ